MKKEIAIPDLDSLLEDSKTNGLYQPTESVFSENKNEEISAQKVETKQGILLIPMNKVKIDPNQVRKRFAPDELNKLAESIKRVGLLEPVGVRPLDDGMYQLCYGERRYRASNLAGLLEIPAIVSDREEKDGRLASLHENLMREDLTPIEVALGIEQYARDYSLKKGEVAQDLGMDNSKVSRYLSLLELPEEIQLLVNNGELKFRHGAELSRFYKESKDLVKSIELAQLCIDRQWSVSELEKTLKKLLKEQPGQGNDKENVQPERISHYEKSLCDQFKTAAQIKVARKGNGKIVINYANAKELEELMALLLKP